jgi:hypothetical protein
MRKLLIALVIGVIAWQAWGAYQTRNADEELLDDGESSVSVRRARVLLADDFMR